MSYIQMCKKYIIQGILDNSVFLTCTDIVWYLESKIINTIHIHTLCSILVLYVLLSRLL